MNRIRLILLSSTILCITAIDAHSTSLFDQTIALAYLQQPQLLEAEKLQEKEPTTLLSSLHIKKEHAYTVADWLSFIFFCSQVSQSYHNIYVAEMPKTGFVYSIINTCTPNFITNSSKHTRFFLVSSEQLLQAYLLKILLKMVIFCFL